MSKKTPPDFGNDAASTPQNARWHFGDFELDESRRELFLNGERVPLEPKPLNLLMLLLRHPGEVITKNDLMEALWTGRFVVDAVLSSCVAKLRLALGEVFGSSLKTVHGFGYRFDVEATLVTQDSDVAVAPPSLTFKVGDTLRQRPNWDLVRRLGRSGDSWLAEHAKTHARRVFKFTNEARGLSALKREVTVYRLLRESLGDKVCYVEVLDWNFDEPPFFIESEYCPGGSLQEWFEAQGGIAKVALATRLDLIIQIAEALAEVHLVGVLHKDLKPANVFIVIGTDNLPKIRLADFGASRLLDPERLAAYEITKAGFTQYIDGNDPGISGTPLYLAPEVLRGNPATVKADIYALGVMLYQFVVGNLGRQLNAGWEVDVADEILRDDIASAADGTPERRLADAAELARNLRKLESRQIAREAEREAQAKAERQARAMDRMKARRVGLIAAFTALAIGFAASTTLYFQSQQARALAEKSAKKANAIAEFMGTDLFANVSDQTKQVQAVTVKEVLDAAAAKVHDRFKGDPLTAAEVHLSLSDSYWALDHIAESIKQCEVALDSAEPISAESSSIAAQAAAKLVIRAYVGGSLVRLMPKIIQTRNDASRFLIESHPALVDLGIEQARARNMLGDWKASMNESLELIRKLNLGVTQNPDAYLSLLSLAGSAQLLMGQAQDAEPKLAEVVRLREVLSKASPSRIAQARITWANALIETGQLSDANRELEVALAAVRDWNGTLSGPEIYAQTTIAKLRARENRLDDALEAALTATSDIRKFISGNADKTQRVPPLIVLADIYSKLGRFSDSELILREAIDLRADSSNPQHPQAFELRLLLAESLINQNKLNLAAEEFYREPRLALSNFSQSHFSQLRFQKIVDEYGPRLKSESSTKTSLSNVTVDGTKFLVQKSEDFSR